MQRKLRNKASKVTSFRTREVSFVSASHKKKPVVCVEKNDTYYEKKKRKRHGLKCCLLTYTHSHCLLHIPIHNIYGALHTQTSAIE